MGNALRDDELFVIEALCRAYGGAWRIGEDPPDVYLMLSDIEIAVEISTLTQYVTNESGKMVPRLSQDSGVIRMCNEINEELNHMIPSGIHFFLIVTAPVKNLRRLKGALIDKICSMIKVGVACELIYELFGNEIEIKLIKEKYPHHKKVIGIIPNRNSNPRISDNASYSLHDRILEKSQKCSHIKHRPLWLALFIDYWLAQPNTYQTAMNGILDYHPFSKICLVSGNEEVYTLFETEQ